MSDILYYVLAPLLEQRFSRISTKNDRVGPSRRTGESNKLKLYNVLYL